MKITHSTPCIRDLMTVLLLLTLIPAGGAHADDTPPGRLIPPVSMEQAMLLPTYTGCGGVYGVPSSSEGYEQEVVEQVNKVRAENGLPPLKRSSSLDDAARYHATDMGQDNYFSHASYDRSGGNLVKACDWHLRVRSYYSGSWSLAENIAAGYTTPESVMEAWMSSSGHRANIMNWNNWEIGVGYYEGSGRYYRYWVQDFGRRSSVYPLIINQEAAETDSCNVSLYIYGDWEEIRLRNDSDAWVAWQPFQATLNWTLSGGVGEHTVWAEMRDGSHTAVSSDTIYLTSTPILGNLPTALPFTYSIPDARLLPATRQVTPMNVGSGDPLTWQITTQGDWFTVTPLTGATPASLRITPATFDTSTVATHTGAVTVTVVHPAGTENSPHRVDLTLQVVNTSLSTVHLPAILHDHMYASLSSPRYPAILTTATNMGAGEDGYIGKEHLHRQKRPHRRVSYSPLTITGR